MKDEFFGFLLIDKDPNMTSHDVVDVVRRKLRCKVGHTGTLDPFATGLLIMVLGKATRLADYMQKQDKEYEVEMELGEERDSYDITGALVEQREVGEISEEKIKSALSEFVGEIEQVPPMHSAVKFEGRRAYKFAREGKRVSLNKRKITIYDIALLEAKLPLVRFKVRCSSGTYIRSLVHDIGVNLGTLAFTKSLRRTEVGKFDVDNAIGLRNFLDMNEEEIDKKVLDPAKALDFISQIEVTEKQLEDIMHGRKIKADIPSDAESPMLAVRNEKLVAIMNIFARNEHATLKPDKVFVQKT